MTDKTKAAHTPGLFLAMDWHEMNQSERAEYIVGLEAAINSIAQHRDALKAQNADMRADVVFLLHQLMIYDEHQDTERIEAIEAAFLDPKGA